MKAHNGLLMTLLLLSLGLLNAQDSTRVADSSIRFLPYSSLSGLPTDTSSIPIIATAPHITGPANVHHDLAGNTGNSGSACFALTPPLPEQYGIKMMDDPLKCYYQDVLRPGKYLLHIPFTHLNFTTAPGKEQNLQVLHAQQFTRSWYADVNFRVNSSPGKYQAQRTDLGTVSSSIAYTAPEKRYEAQLSFWHYKYRITENGGIANDSIFLSGTETDPGVIPVNLNNAASVRRNTEWVFRQALQLHTTTDSIPISWLPSTLTHTLGRSREYRTFSDPDPIEEYYPAILNNLASTLDSIGMTRFYSTLSLSNAPAARLIHYALGTRFEEANYYDGGSTQKLILVQPYLSLKIHPIKGHTSSLAIRQTLPGQFQGSSWHIDHVAYHSDTSLQWRILLHHDMVDPVQMVRHYRGNHYAWAGNIRTTEYLSSGASLRFRNIEAETRLTRTSHSIMFGSDGVPFQYHDPLHLATFLIGHQASLGPVYHHSRIRYHLLEDTPYQPYPAWIASSTIMVMIRPFKREFSLNAGTDLTWMSQWTGYTYEPVTGAFHLQNNGTQGNHLLADVFVSLFMQRATICLKYRHLGNLLIGEGYYLLQGYPMSVPGLMFSVQWSFFD